MQLFTIAFERPIEFMASLGMALIIVLIVLFSAKASDGRSRWTRFITGPNAKVAFGLMFVAWAVVFGIGLQLVPHEGASTPYGGLGLIAMFSGVFIMFGFLWAVIGE